MKAEHIRFFLPKSLINKEVQEKDRVDFIAKDLDGVGLYLFSRWVEKMGGGVYTYSGMASTPEDNQLERMFSFIRHQLECIPETYEDDEDDADTSMRYLDQIEELLQTGELNKSMG